VQGCAFDGRIRTTVPQSSILEEGIRSVFLATGKTVTIAVKAEPQQEIQESPVEMTTEEFFDEL